MNTKVPEQFPEKIYEYLSESGEERVCDAISEESCRELPGNYLLIAVNGFSSKFAEQIASPELVIPWIFSLMGVPAFFSGLLIPVKNAGSLLPQLFVSGKIRSFSRRKYFWSFGALIQMLMMLLIAWVIGEEFTNAGYIIIGALLIFSIGSGIASVAFKDVMGKTIPKGKRGKLLAVRATGGGILTILAGVVFYFFISGIEDVTIYKWLFVASAALWLLAAVLFFLIEEESGATSGGRTPIKELQNGLRILREDTNYRNFLITRGLFLSIPLLQPFLILYAQERIGITISGLGLFVIVTGISNTISSPFWGKFTDKSSRGVMKVSALFAVLICLYVVGYQWLPEEWQNIYTFSPVFFLIIIVYGGARMARKTYLVDYAPVNERPLYVSMANTVIGVLVLVSGALGLVANYFGLTTMIGVFACLLLLGAWSASRLQET